jgi:arginine-tRNA-protein transferase
VAAFCAWNRAESPIHRISTVASAAQGGETVSEEHMLHRTTRRPQFFYTTAPMPCPYLAGRTERKVVTELTGTESEALHDRLSRAGFRRSHNIAYSPVCPGCQACIPIRIVCDRFQPDRTQRRVARDNADLTAHEAGARATAEQFNLFQRYQQARHNDGDMASMGFYDYRAMIEDTPITTHVVEFRDTEGRLVAACLTDRLSDGLSAVYSFYDPELERRSLGTYAVLWLVRHALELGLPYVYLGYWVPQSRKMAYKARFRPSEILTGGHWRELLATDVAQPTE